MNTGRTVRGGDTAPRDGEHWADYPGWVRELPEADVRFPGARGHLVGGMHGQVVLWSFPDGGTVLSHAHGPQLGFVIAGQVDLETPDGVVSYHSGGCFSLARDEPHGAVIHPRSLVVEVFQEHDRHSARPSGNPRPGTGDA
ncbi:hypothetical protein OK074_1777 [Actinobacteria bacterium OK074]|nr:hypothetical protein OK074_1777 [Actinobacteria bacterium OK074]